VASLDVLRALGSAGFECQAFCTSRLDFREDVLLEKLIVQSGEPLKVRPSVCPSGHARLLHTRRHQVPIAAAPKGATASPGRARICGCPCFYKEDRRNRMKNTNH
jgi:hypothetical protein